MRNHLTEQFDLMKDTIDKLKGIIFCEVSAERQGQKLTDQEVLSQASCILAEHEIVAGQIALKYAR